eukprot:7332472-Alexandrium_andersonii.AAC.1
MLKSWLSRMAALSIKPCVSLAASLRFGEAQRTPPSSEALKGPRLLKALMKLFRTAMFSKGT